MPAGKSIRTDSMNQRQYINFGDMLFFSKSLTNSTRIAIIEASIVCIAKDHMFVIYDTPFMHIMNNIFVESESEK